MYGADLETIAEGKAKTLLHFFGDDQVSFRSIILAGVNWLQYVNYVKQSPGRGIISYSPVDILGNLLGKDNDTATFRTTFNAYEAANSIYAIVDGKRAIEVPYKGNLEGTKELKESDSFKGGGKVVYAKLQDAMTALLDRVYAQQGWGNDQRLEATFIPFLLNPNEKVTLAGKNMINVLNNLDKRGRLAFTYKIITEDSQLAKIRYYEPGYHSYVFNWRYD